MHVSHVRTTTPTHSHTTHYLQLLYFLFLSWRYRIRTHFYHRVFHSCFHPHSSHYSASWHTLSPSTLVTPDVGPPWPLRSRRLRSPRRNSWCDAYVFLLADSSAQTGKQVVSSRHHNKELERVPKTTRQTAWTLQGIRKTEHECSRKSFSVSVNDCAATVTTALTTAICPVTNPDNNFASCLFMIMIHDTSTRIGISRFFGCPLLRFSGAFPSSHRQSSFFLFRLLSCYFTWEAPTDRSWSSCGGNQLANFFIFWR